MRAVYHILGVRNMSYLLQDLPRSEVELETFFIPMLSQLAGEPLVCNLLVNTIIRYMGYHRHNDPHRFMQAFYEHSHIVEQLPYSDKPCKVLHTDARSIPLPDNSVDLVITGSLRFRVV